MDCIKCREPSLGVKGRVKKLICVCSLQIIEHGAKSWGHRPEARADSGNRKPCWLQAEIKAGNPGMGKLGRSHPERGASEFGVGGDSVLEHALSDRKRACVLSWSRESLKPLSCFTDPKDPEVN